MRYVAYLRVSTERQGKSGLGLAAQRLIIDRFLKPDDELLADFVEVQSGRNDERVELWKAISHAKRHDAKLVIAKLDRFSRRVSFIAGIMEQGIGLVVAELPNATDFQLHIFAALAQEERRLISERTRSALAEAKRRGIVLGRNGRVLAVKHREEARHRAETLRATLAPMMSAGLSYGEMARQLNARGVKSPNGGKFHPQQIANTVSRLSRSSAQ